MSSQQHHSYTSSEGDLLLIDKLVTAGLYVSCDNLGAFLRSPGSVPHYSFTKPIELETFRLALELGFEFRPVRPASLEKHTSLKDSPVLRFVLAGKLRLLLVPAPLVPTEIVPILAADSELGIVVSHTLALPRDYASAYAVRIMSRSFRRRNPSTTQA